MSSRRWRLQPLVVLASLALTALALVTAYYATRTFLLGTLASQLEPSDLRTFLDDFASAFLAFSVIALLITGVAALLLSCRARAWLSQLRRAAIARGRGAGWTPTGTSISELQGLELAIEHMAAALEERANAFRRERDELALLNNAVSEGVLLVGEDGHIVHANPAARRLLRLPESCRGQPLDAVVRQAELRGFLHRLEPSGAPVTVEIAVQDRRLLVHGRRLGADNSAGNGARGALLAFIDLTELRRLEGVRRDFVANVSHELRTPLTPIRGYAETLLHDDLDEATRRRFLEVIHRNAERLHRIVDDLLDLSRLESGAWKPKLEEVSVGRIIADTWHSFAERAASRQITFVPPRDDARVLADAVALQQILSNLIDNAIRHTGPGGRITVTLHTGSHDALAARPGPPSTPDRRMVAIDVTDTGTGIPSDALPRIFERFYRVDPTRSREEGGTGLGLSIVRHLAESMQGDVSAASELGRGTTIRVRLPAVA